MKNAAFVINRLKVMETIRVHLKANDAAMNVILNTSYQDESKI